MRWLLRITRWRDPDLEQFACRYDTTSTRDLVILILYKLSGAYRGDDAAMNRAADKLDASSDRLEDRVLANTPPTNDR